MLITIGLEQGIPIMIIKVLFENPRIGWRRDALVVAGCKQLTGSEPGYGYLAHLLIQKERDLDTGEQLDDRPDAYAGLTVFKDGRCNPTFYRPKLITRLLDVDESDEFRYRSKYQRMTTDELRDLANHPDPHPESVPSWTIEVIDD